MQEVIRDRHNGLLVDSLRRNNWPKRLMNSSTITSLAQELGKAARSTVLQHYRLADCVQRQLALMALVASGSIGEH